MRRPPRYDLPNAAPGGLRLVQELVNTSDHEHGREWLATPDELEHWFAARGLAADGLGPKELARVHAFREGLRELLIANNEPRPIPADAVEELGRAADRSRLTLSFGRRGTVELAATASPLTVKYISWGVVGLDSNTHNTGRTAFASARRLCSIGKSSAAGVVAT